MAGMSQQEIDDQLWIMGSGSGEEPLLRAVWDGDRDVLIRLLEEGADANTADDADRKALQYAAHKRNIDMAEILIGAGADVNGPAPMIWC